MWRPHPDAPHDENLRQFWVHLQTEGTQTNRSSTRIEASAEVTGENLEQLQCQALAQLFSDNTDPIHSGSAGMPPMLGVTNASAAPSVQGGQGGKGGADLLQPAAGNHGDQQVEKKDKKTKKEKKDKNQKNGKKGKRGSTRDANRSSPAGGHPDVEVEKHASKKKKE